MILLLDTSTPECHLTLVQDGNFTEYTWQADRELARGLLKFIVDTLAEQDASITSLEGLGVLRGPGSFTGLRIGITTLNTIADSEQVPIVGATGDEWKNEAAARLAAGENDQIVLPEYGRDARITTPRK